MSNAEFIGVYGCSLAAGGSPGLHGDLASVVILFGTGLLVAWLLRSLRGPSILGFLLAGIFVGPSGVDLIHQDRVHFFAELGLVLLLFTVGLELSPGPLLRMGGRLLWAASIQIGVCTLLTALVVALATPAGWSAALIAGVAVALSSTAIVLKTLSDRGETDTPAGAVTTGILLIQDVVVIVVLIMLPLLATAGGNGWSAALGKIGLVLVGLVVLTLVARFVLPIVIGQMFKRGGRELMTLFAVVMACAGAWLASLADFSWALGACVAGLLLAQTDLRHQLAAEITPFRDAFNALFFMSIGMLVDLRLLAEMPVLLLVLVLTTLVGKAIITSGAVLAGGWPVRLALAAGLGLCTVSEFGYVLAKEAAGLGFLSETLFDQIVALTVGSMLLGAALVPASGPLANILAQRLRRSGESEPSAGNDHELRDHVIIVGYGINGENLARVLHATHVAHVVVELDRGNAARAREHGTPVIVGDATRMALLEHAGLAQARALVVCIADVYATRRVVAQVHRARPELYILARTRYIVELERLYRLGARQVIPEEFETSIEIFAHLLRELAIPYNVIEQQVTLVRAGQYGMLRGRPTDTALHAAWWQLLEAAVTQTCLVMPGSPAEGRTIRELNLRARTGVTIVAVTRGGKPVTNPPPDYRFEAGDVLVLVGTHHELVQARQALAPPEEEVADQPDLGE